MEREYDDTQPAEVAPGVFHLGVKDSQNSWANIPYLVVDGDEAVLIDPGSAKPDFFACTLRKVHAVVDPRKIRHMIVQHQDPDLCAALPLFETVVSPEAEIHCPLEAALLVQHYGLKSKLRSVDDGDTLTFGGGRTLTFAMTPYAHFIGSMVTYDSTTKTVFSSDAFGGFTVSDDIYATENYPDQLGIFLGQYLGSKRALEYALKRLEQIAAGPGIDLICPQHGCVIAKEAIPTYMAAAHALEVGGEIDRLCRKHGIELEWQEVRRGQAKSAA